MSNSNKAKYWCAILYPDNMLPDWEDSISDILQLPYAYCIHDQDLDKDGDDRTKHMHLMLAFPNTTTYNHALSVFRELNAPGKQACNTCKRVISVRRMYDYLIHDTDEARAKNKHQYSPDERILGNNFDIGAYEQLGIEEKEKIRRDLSLVLLDKNFITYALFYQYVVENYDDEYERIVVAYQGHFDKLCKGCYHKWERLKKLEERENNREQKKG